MATAAPLFDCAAAWDSLGAITQRELGAALIAERLAWRGYGGEITREGLRDCALAAGSFITERLRWSVLEFNGALPAPDLRGFLPNALQCRRCASPQRFPEGATPEPPICALCWREDVRRSERERQAALRSGKP